MKVDVKLPFTVEAGDYHEFDYIEELLCKFTGLKIEHIELDMDDKEDFGDHDMIDLSTGQSPYVARFYVATDKQIEELENDL